MWDELRFSTLFYNIKKWEKDTEFNEHIFMNTNANIEVSDVSWPVVSK
jgi:hypothetical protein